MLDKCSNPSCTNPFRRLTDGKLFRLESDPAARSSRPAPAEYFWLCSTCSTTMTVRLSDDGMVIAAVVASSVGGDGDSLRRNRQKGLLLTSVRILGPRNMAAERHSSVNRVA